MGYIRIAVIAWLAYVIAYLGRMNFAALIPVIRDTYNFSNTQMGLIASTLFLAYTIFQIPSGALVDRIGLKYVFTFGCFLMFLGNMLILTWILPLMLVAQFINGVGQSTGWSSMVKLTSKTQAKAKAIGILSSAVPAGTFLSFIVASFFTEILGINYAFIFPASLLALLAIVSISFFPAEKGEEFSLGFVKNRNVVILALTQFSVFFSMIGLLTWSSAYFHDTFSIGKFEAIRFASLLPLAGIIGGVAGGHVSEYLGERNTVVLNQLMAAVLFILAFFVRDLNLSFIVLFLAAIFFRFGAGPTYSLAVKTAEQYSASISGFLTFVANIGGVISTAMMGVVADSVGFRYAFAIFASLFILTALISVRLEEG